MINTFNTEARERGENEMLRRNMIAAIGLPAGSWVLKPIAGFASEKAPDPDLCLQ